MCLFSFFFYQVFAKGVDPDTVVLMAARASRIENQDAIDTAIVGMLADPKEVTCLMNCFLCGLFLIVSQLILFFCPIPKGTSRYSRSALPSFQSH